MSSSISTPDALSSNAYRASGTCWRVIEAQHRVSTMKITDTQAEQELLDARRVHRFQDSLRPKLGGGPGVEAAEVAPTPAPPRSDAWASTARAVLPPSTDASGEN